MKKIFYGWWVVLACFLITLYVAGAVFFGLTAFFEPLIKEFGWSYTQISFAASLRGLEMGIFAPLFGFLVDRFGSRRLVFFGVVTVAAGMILFSFTQSLYMFYASFLLLGLGAGSCTTVVTMSLIAHWFDKKVGKAMGLMASGNGASGAMVPVIVWLIGAFQWRNALLILSLGMLALGLPLAFIIRNQPEQYGYLPDGRTAPEGAHGEEKRLPEATITFWQAFRRKSFLYLNIVEAFRMMAVMAVATHVMPYLESVKISRSTAGIVAAAIPLVSIVGRLSFGWLGDYWAKRYAMALAFGFMAAGLFLFGFLEIPFLIIPFLIFFPISFGGTMVLRGAIVREYYGRDSFGRLIGIVMGSASLGGIVGPTLAGWIFDSMGSYGGVWFGFSALAAISIGLALRMKQ